MELNDSQHNSLLNDSTSSIDNPTGKFALLAKLDEMKKAIDGYREYKSKNSQSCNTSQILTAETTEQPHHDTATPVATNQLKGFNMPMMNQ